MPCFKILHPSDEEKIPNASQSQYTCGIGMIYHLIKESKPNFVYVIHELSQCMNGASVAAYKEMIGVIRFLLDTRDTSLK
jgi:hypothetical protein